MITEQYNMDLEAPCSLNNTMIRVGMDIIKNKANTKRKRHC